MQEAGVAPEWVQSEVLPSVDGRVRSLHMLSEKSAIVFLEDHAIVAEKGAFSGVRLYRVDFPSGFLVNGSKCPHCGEPLREPVGKVARLASDATPKARAKAPAKRRRR